MSINSVFPEQYEQQLEEKRARIDTQFARFQIPELKVFRSPESHFRMRAEFKIWHEKGQAHYAMYQPGEYKKPFIIEDFPVGSELINSLMPRLLGAVNASEPLSRKLFQAEFLTTLSGEAVITLIYHKPLDDAWQAEAEALSTSLGCSLIGRSRKQKRVIGQDSVTECLQVKERTFSYQQVESGFTQPNARVCEKMLAWAVESAAPLSGDLLELYCGNGNFTLPLSQQFDRVLATEISKTSVHSALHNLAQNQIDNVQIVRMSSEEFSQAMDGVRSFRRLRDIDLGSYRFSTVFVDPPRAGLDDHTTDVVKRFDHILYISCNPDTLARNLESICETHDIKRFALFDQFPYTHHIECGALLSRRP
ncbi:tRNA (uridine(54)-C5)-methyltransferase TrmA [Pseudomaricurvus alkylphenolicus]|uniref:tRNA (uridine(54)-C5)-methyltransferase TrmA n=1 Tax=Pseudomaricurvus alkylphenolicus TaxID=1306991 RepID=UPI0014248AA3|nr:tRNA (uridine(54)-C5)-methyltransferase TrmA [Pseudomaricurvus alkylphenolicus]NIB41141.1 tRNA (uridine(54)-C5)-methyltransferase TrmA [Pseudomaricurvus alkylphenolicus]